jgi:hypothetical protein
MKQLQPAWQVPFNLPCVHTLPPPPLPCSSGVYLLQPAGQLSGAAAADLATPQPSAAAAATQVCAAADDDAAAAAAAGWGVCCNALLGALITVQVDR